MAALTPFDKKLRRIGAWLLVLLSIVTAYLFYSFIAIRSEYSVDQFKQPDHPIVVRSQKVLDKFGIEDRDAYQVLLRQEESWVNKPMVLEQLRDYVSKIQDQPGVEKVISLATFPLYQEDEDLLEVVDLVDVMVGQNKTWSDLPFHPVLQGQLISPDFKSTLVVVVPEQSLGIEDHLNLMDFFKVQYPDKSVSVAVGGSSAIKAQMSHRLDREILKFILLSLLCVLVVLSILFRGWMPAVLALTITAVCNIVVMGALSLLGFKFTVLSSTLPVLIMVVTVAIVTHTLSKLSRLYGKRKSSKPTFIFLTLKDLYLAHMLTALTTSVGFATFLSSDAPIIKDYGASVSLGLLMTMVVTLCLLPSMLVWMPPIRKRNFKLPGLGFSPKFIKVLALLFCSALIGSSLLKTRGQINWNVQMLKDLPDADEARKVSEYVASHMGGLLPLHVSIFLEQIPKDWSHPDQFEKLDTIAGELRGWSELKSVTSGADYLRLIDEKSRLPSSEDDFFEKEFLYTLAESNPMESYFADDLRRARYSILMDDLGALDQKKVLERLQVFLDQRFPEARVELQGKVVTVHPMGFELSKELMSGFFTAMGLIFLLLIIVFKSMSWPLVAVIPNLLPAIMIYFGLSLFQIPVRPPIAIIFAISLGLAFDNTVYLLQRLKKIVKGKVVRKRHVIKAFNEERGPCLVASLSLMLGFSVFLTSEFNMNRSFGAFMLLSLFAGLVGDLIVLPFVLKTMPWLLDPNGKTK